MKNKYTILIPIHEFNAEIGKYLKKALESVIKQKNIDYKPNVMLVVASKVYNKVDTFIKKLNIDLDVELLNNTEITTFQGQVNFASNYITTDYFLILEFDDELNSNYLQRVDKYFEELDDVSVILNINLNVDVDDKALYMSNDIAWSEQFSGKNAGYISLEGLIEYSDFRISGGLIKTDIFKNIGGLKNNIKLTFNYEYLLRTLNNGQKVYVIPKIGCKHVDGRENSLFENYKKDLSIAERKYWFDVAQKEYFFNNDRVIKTFNEE